VKCVTFNPLRTIGIPHALYIKPEHMHRHMEAIMQADWVLFPEYWQVNALYYALKKRIFPSVASFHLGHDKIEMTRALEALCPEHVPYTEILASTPANVERVLETFTFPFVAKTVRSSMGRGVYLIENESQFRHYADTHEILYVQEKLDIDRDVRIAVVGRKAIGAYWRIAGRDGFLNNVAQGGRIAFDPVPRAVIDLVENVARALDINHAGFDVAIENGWPYFLEFNVLFGHDGFQKMGVSVEQHILEYLTNEHHTTTPPFTPVSFGGKKTS
jgi:ribosomal protein S6--L-glutamate ligase